MHSKVVTSPTVHWRRTKTQKCPRTVPDTITITSIVFSCIRLGRCLGGLVRFLLLGRLGVLGRGIVILPCFGCAFSPNVVFPRISSLLIPYPENTLHRAYLCTYGRQCRRNPFGRKDWAKCHLPWRSCILLENVLGAALLQYIAESLEAQTWNDKVECSILFPWI